MSRDFHSQKVNTADDRGGGAENFVFWGKTSLEVSSYLVIVIYTLKHV